METSILTPVEKHAAAGLFAIALHQSQVHQTRPSSSAVVDGGESVSDVSVPDNPRLWVHENSDLLPPILRFLEVDSQAWHGLQETAGSSSQAMQHIKAFLTSLSEDSSEGKDKELALTKALEAVELTLETTPDSSDDPTRSHEYEQTCREKYSNPDVKSCSHGTSALQRIRPEKPTVEDAPDGSRSRIVEKPVEEGTLVSYPRKVTVLYELLSACLAKANQKNEKCSPIEKAYDARHRVALRLLTTWLGVQWIKMEAMEILVTSSLMASVTTEGAKEEGTKNPGSPWDKWKRGGMIGAAAVTGGTLLAITGGLAAPAIAGGFSAMGLSAAAGAVGSAAGSAAFATSFGAAGAGLTGKKMARRTGSIEEFEFKAVGENHNQGRLAVGILVSGLIFEAEHFVRPWEGHNINIERYALQWETKHLIAVTTAIQDWLTSRVAIELMKQGAMMTVVSTLLSALSLPSTLLSITDVIDSRWAVAVDRSDKAGKLLAEVLLQGLHGRRPITLIGYSLGARVVFKCLQSLAEIGDHVSGLGVLPKPSSGFQMVAGRFVNAYSANDWTLGIAFRASLLSQGLAGIQPVDVSGIENVDATHLIEGHYSYLWTVRQILEQLELESPDPVYMAIDSES